MTNGPILFDLEENDDGPAPNVADAPPVPDLTQPAPDGAAMQVAAKIATRKPSVLSRLFWGLAAAVLGAVVSVAAWDFVLRLLERAPILGWAVTGLVGAFLLVLLVIALREIAALGRLRRIDGLHRAADTALADQDLAQAKAVAAV